MWRLAVVTVVLWNTITSQPITDDPQNGPPPRLPRQLDFVHCCPCPAPDLPHLPAPGPAARAGGAGAGPVDDCPCRTGRPDSQGASSVFFPRAVPRPFVNMPDSPKEDQKPLLHPEVDLASSMLETLREVTDEEYQDALARDAARYAARVNELGDVEPETADNLVTIIVNPKDADDDTEVTPEASNVQETRCSHPLGTPHLGHVRDTPKFFEQPDLFHKDAFDLESGASEAKESVVGLGKGLEGLKSKTKSSVLKLFPTRKDNEGNIQSLLKFKNDKQPIAAADNLKSNFGSSIPNLRFTPLLKKKEPVPLTPLKFDFTHLKFPTLRTNLGKKPKTSDAKSVDSSSSPSNLQEQLSKPIFDLKTLIPAPDPHFNLKNLLNLKDVELIPPKSNIPKIQIQGLDLLPPFKSHATSKPCKDKEKEIGKDVDIERSQKFQTDILDTIPNASENHPVVSLGDEDKETTTVELNNAVPVSQNADVKTQILDVLPSASENTHIVVSGEHDKSLPPQPSTEILENINAVRELEQQPTEEPIVESDQTLSKDEKDNMEDDDSSLELIVTGDEDTEIEAVEFIEETDQPDNNIGGVTFEDNAQNFDIHFIEDTSNIDESGSESTFLENDSESLGFGPEEDEMEDEASEGQLLFRENISSNEAIFNVDGDSINGDTHLVSEEDTEQRSFSDSDLRSVEYQDEVGALPTPNTDPMSSSLKERISLKLETLRNPDRSKILTISRYSIPEKEENATTLSASKDATDFAAFTEETQHVLIDEQSAEMETGASNRVTIQDLSKMSDALLAASRSEAKNSQTTNEVKTSEDNSDRNIEDSTDSNTLQTKITNPEWSSSNTESVVPTLRAHSMKKGFTNIDDNFTNNRDTENNNFKEALEEDHTVDDTCPSHLEAKQDSSLGPKSAITDTRSNVNEMIPQASETKFRTAPQPLGFAPFLQQSIVQPDSLFNPSSLLPPISPLNVGDLNLPTLEELTSGLEGLLGGNARASNGDVTSSEFASAEDCSETEAGMATGASTNKAKSAFASLKALEDINLDIFHINPLSPDSLSSRMPSLNLNSFKTKLALPPSLDLKPLKLESALGRKNGGLLGASLTFGPEKNSRKAVNKLGSILNKQGSDILGNSLKGLPSLEELRATMRTNTQSLLKSPLIQQTFNPLEDTLRSSQAFADNLRSHTENTMKNLQQSLPLTLTDSRSRGANNGGNKFTKPQELVEMVTLAHEDMNDKLHAIHIDLQDRLNSIHDRILDQSNIPALKTPLLGLAKIEEEPKGTWRIATPKNRLSNQVQGSRLTANSKKVVAKKPKAKANKPKSKDINDMKPFKISKAASSLTPKSVEVPKLVTSPSTPQFFRPSHQDDSLKLREPGSGFLNVRPTAPQLKQFKPFGDFKITIATSPTPKPTTSNRENSRPSVHNEHSSGFKTLSKPVKSKSYMDSKGFASEPKPSQVPGPLRPVTPTFDSKEASVVRSSSSLPSPKPFVESRAPTSAIPEKVPSKIGPLKVSLPKPTESPLVTKMREAIRIHLSRPVQPKKLQHMDKLAKPIQANDMRNAASENNAVVIKPETMQENVSYRCKMVCVRD